MPSGRIPNHDRLRRMAELHASGLTHGQIARILGVTRQRVQRALNPKFRPRRVRIRCRVCDSDINPAGAVPRDDRNVYCMACLAQRPDLPFGEHLKAFRMAAGLKIVDLANKVGIRPTVISGYEHGRIGSPSWARMVRLFQALGVSFSGHRFQPLIPNHPEVHPPWEPARQTESLLSVG